MSFGVAIDQSAFAAELLRPGRSACGGRSGSRRSPDAVADTSDQRIGAAIGMNSCARRSAAPPRRAARRAGRRPARRARHRAARRLPRSQIGATPQRNRRRNQAGEVDGATSSTSAKSAGGPVPARSTLMPSAPQSSAQPAEAAARRPGPSGSAIAERRPLGVAEQAVGLARSAPARRSASGGRQPRRLRPGRRRRRARPRARSRAATRPGTSSAAISASRSIAWLSSRRTSGSSSGPPLRAGTRPNRPAPDRSAARLRGSFDRAGEGQVGEGAAEHQVGLAGGERARSRARRSAPRSRTSSRAAFVAVGTATRRASGAARRAGRLGRRSLNGPVPWPSRTSANSGWASSCEQVGARRAQPDLDHPVGHRDDSSTAPSVSLSGLRAARRASCRLRIRATCWR